MSIFFPPHDIVRFTYSAVLHCSLLLQDHIVLHCSFFLCDYAAIRWSILLVVFELFSVRGQYKNCWYQCSSICLLVKYVHRPIEYLHRVISAGSQVQLLQMLPHSFPKTMVAFHTPTSMVTLVTLECTHMA